MTSADAPAITAIPTRPTQHSDAFTALALALPSDDTTLLEFAPKPLRGDAEQGFSTALPPGALAMSQGDAFPPQLLTHDLYSQPEWPSHSFAIKFAPDVTSYVEAVAAQLSRSLADLQGPYPASHFTCDYITASALANMFDASTQPATSVLPLSQPLLGQVKALFEQDSEEIFIDGFDSQFGRTLVELVTSSGAEAVHALQQVIHDPTTSIEDSEEALRCMGYMADPWTHQERLALLVKAMTSSNLRVRDAASIGIAALDDPAALPSLQEAILREPSIWLRATLEEISAQFKASL